MPDHRFGFDTLCLHAGQIPDAQTGARALPIYQTTSFVFDSAEHAANLFNLATFGNVYSRLSNPTVAALEERARAGGHTLTWAQTDHEGTLIEHLLGARAEGVEAVVLNAGALTHTSYALRDAIEACGVPVVEVHISNVHAREPFRRVSVIADVCRGSIVGFGSGSYHLALEAMPRLSDEHPGLAYLVVGDGPDRARLEAKAAELGLGGRVVFAGRIPECDKAAHYRLADAFVMPGRARASACTATATWRSSPTFSRGRSSTRTAWGTAR